MAKKIGRALGHAHRHRFAVYQSMTSIALHFLVAFGLTLALTGQAVISGVIAVVEPVVCHFAHHVHDWVWRGVRSSRLTGLTQPARQTTVHPYSYRAGEVSR